MIEPSNVLTVQKSSIYDVFRREQREGYKPINLTIGNPNLKPPAVYYEAMRDLLFDFENSEWNMHGYIVDEDPFGLCRKIAQKLSTDYNMTFEVKGVAITVGATGAIDIILKTILDQAFDDQVQNTTGEVIIIAPYFIEYINIVKSNNGRVVIVNSNDRYGLDISAIEKSITANTKAIIINSPNNPTGKVYSEEELMRLADLLKRKNNEYCTSINVLEDSVYDTIVFTSEPVPSMIPHYPFVFKVNSYSKSMSLSGERIGYFAVHPGIGDVEKRDCLRSALHLNMRMRVVHAPMLQHRILAKLPVNCVTDVNYYKINIETLYACVTDIGFIAEIPEGTFYLWATLPEHYKGEERFREFAQTGNDPLLYLPGTLFGGEAYRNCIRFSCCVSEEIIKEACKKLHQIDKNILSER